MKPPKKLQLTPEEVAERNLAIKKKMLSEAQKRIEAEDRKAAKAAEKQQEKLPAVKKDLPAVKTKKPKLFKSKPATEKSPKQPLAPARPRDGLPWPTNPVEIMKRYKAASGVKFALIPLMGVDDPEGNKASWGKAPLHPDWQKVKPGNTIHPSNLAGRNLGIAIQDDMLIIDEDPRNFKNGQDSLVMFFEAAGLSLDEMRTFIVRTGGGGTHRYYRCPKGFNFIRDLKPLGFPGIEIKGHGQQVVACGCMHQSGNQYIEHEDSTGIDTIADAPAKLLAYIERKATEMAVISPERQEAAEYTDAKADIEKAVAFLERHGPAIEGQGGDGHTFKAAAFLHDLNLSPGVALELLLDWNQKCEPHWQVEELEAKIENAYRYCQNVAGAKSVVRDFEILPPLPDEPVPLVADLETGDVHEIIDPSITGCLPEGWERCMATVGKTGLPKPNHFYNFYNFCRLQPQLSRIFGKNEYTNKHVLVSPPPWSIAGRPGVTTKKVKNSEGDIIEVSKIVNKNGLPLEDSDYMQLRKYAMDQPVVFEAQLTTIREAVQGVCLDYTFHPVKKWLNSLKWDGVERLDFWLQNHLGVVDDPYSRAISSLSIMAPVTRVFEPGAKFDIVPVLQGPQGYGKSSAWRILGGDYYLDGLGDVSNKDTIQQIQGMMFVEMSEMYQPGVVSQQKIKAFISCSSDVIRPAYAHEPKTYPRTCIIVATTNDSNYLKDETGNRRWCPILVGVTGPADLKGLVKWREQIFAEAVYRHHNDFQPLFIVNREAQRIAKQLQENARDRDGWEDVILEWIGSDEHMELYGKVDRLMINDVWVYAFGKSVAAFDKYAQHRIVKTLVANGWKYGSVRIRLKGKEVVKKTWSKKDGN